jgi:hypothetical protein
MLPTTLNAILALLATASAWNNRRNRNHREITNNLGSRGIFDEPEHDPDEVLVQIINAPGSSAGQWLTFDGTEFTAFTTSTHAPVATGISLANKAVVTGSGSSINQIGAGSDELEKSPPVVQSGGGILSQAEMDEWLNVHNVARSQHGAGALQWDEALAVGAKSNAVQCKGEHTYVVV